MPVRGVLAVLALIGGAFAAITSGGHHSAHSAATATAAASTQGGGAGLGPGTPLPKSDAKLLGQRIMVGMSGKSAPPALLARVRAGQVGAVILFSANIGSRPQLTALTSSLQRAARQGRNPPLLIATDQEGGQVKRLPNGPPTASPPQIGATGKTAVAFSQGRATGRYLKGLGINMDLAPVADVPTFPGAFIWRQGRAFSFNADTVARLATSFAAGLQSAHEAATAKHFPGLGSAAVSTDTKLDILRPTKAQLAAALKPYRSLIPRGVDAVLLSMAAFPAYDPTNTPTAFSRPAVQGLLRGTLGFKGVAITDGLGAPTGHDEVTAGVLAAGAGADILLYTDAATGELTALESALHQGRISRADADASYQRIIALKQQVA
jgi:beta-N-acetylhexosaminidase